MWDAYGSPHIIRDVDCSLQPIWIELESSGHLLALILRELTMHNFITTIPHRSLSGRCGVTGEVQDLCCNSAEYD